MSKRYLKASWLDSHLARLIPLLPRGSAVAIWLDGRPLAAAGEAGDTLMENGAGVVCGPIAIEGTILGKILLRCGTGSDLAVAGRWVEFLTHGLQALIESQHARHSVAQEALESYREVSLLQRAVTALNQSLKPAAVATALLRELNGRKYAADYGAVLLCDEDASGYTTIHCFGDQAESAFSALQSSALFASMIEQTHGDIINDLAASPLCQGETATFRSLLWLPLIFHENTLGILILASSAVDGFAAADLRRAQTLASVASGALHNARLYAAEQEMFRSFVRMIATAIDAKSPYTAGHCRRVPEIALMLAEKAHASRHPSFAGYSLSDGEREAIEIAAMLHDCGKVVTPEWVADKATKLESIVDRMKLITLRFEILRREALIQRNQGLDGGRPDADKTYQATLTQLDDDLVFLEACNRGGEFISPVHVARIKDIASRRWIDAHGQEHPLLDDNEVYNLCIARGTLNTEERKIIEDHAVHTINMLSQIRFPQSLRNVTDYAGSHHERVNGTGYPRGLRRAELTIPACIIAIADIFEALTAPDRPYRKGGSLSWAIDIMHRMRNDGHIDADLFELFLIEGVHQAYAEKHLTSGQIDQVDVSRYLT